MPEQFDAYHTWLGIPPAEQPPHLYRLLGVSAFEQNPDVIEHAADRQMAHLRSLNTGKRAALTQNLLDELAKARVCLLDAKKKAAYDEQLTAKLAAEKPAPASADPAHASDLPFDVSGQSGAFAVVSPRSASKRLKKSSSGPAGIAILLGVGAAIAAIVVLYPVVAGMLGQNGDPAQNNAQPRTNQVAEGRPSATPTPSKNSETAAPLNSRSQSAASADDSSTDAKPTASPFSSTIKTNDPKPAPARPVEKRPTGGQRPTSTEDDFGGTSDPFDSQAGADKPAPLDKSPALAVVRVPVPSDEKRQQSEKLARELFEKEFAAAKKPAEKGALSLTLLKQADDTKDDPVGQYALLMLARDSAAAAGDTALTIKIVDRLSERFEINRNQELADDLTKLLETAATVPAQQALAEAGLAAANEAADAGDYDLALRIARTALDAARKSKDAKLIKQVTDRGRELTALQKDYVAFTAAKTALQADPTDAAANLAVGRWYWFTKNDADGAIPYLAKASDAGLKAAAEKELAAPEEASAQLELADAWWDLSQATKIEAEKNAISIHALAWYMKAVPQLNGLLKAKAEKRMAEIHSLTDKVALASADKTQDKAATGSTAAGTPVKPKLLPGLVGEYYTGKNFDTLIGSRVDAGPSLAFAETPGSQVPGDDFSIRWTGYLSAPKAGNYKIKITSDDGCRVYVDGKRIIDSWKDVDDRGGFGGFGGGFGKGKGKGGPGGSPGRAGEPNKGEAVVALTKEPHDFKVEYYQSRSVKSLTVSWELEGAAGEQAIAPQFLSHDPPPKKTPATAPK